MKAVLLTAASLFLLVGTGCGGSLSSRCNNVCAQYNACALTERVDDYDCNQMCNDVSATQARQAAAGASSCETEYDTYLSCWEGASDAQVCDSTFTGCKDAATAFKSCMSAYCASAASTDADGHKDLSCTSAGATVFRTY